MKRHRLFVALVSSGGLVLATLWSASWLRAVAQADVIDDPEAYAVYAAVLPLNLFRSDPPPAQIALLDETRAGILDSRTDDRFPVEWKPVLENFRRENGRVRRLQPGHDFGLAYTFVTWAELSRLMQAAGYDLATFCCNNAPGWEVFTRLPGGKLVAVSAVGFNADKTRAMVTVQYDCFPSQRPRAQSSVCHEGGQIAVEKEAGRWVLAKLGLGTWIASAKSRMGRASGSS